MFMKLNGEDYIERIERCSKAWRKFVRMGGIKKILTPEEFYLQMQKNNIRENIMGALRRVRTSNASFEALAHSDGTNYFLINDISNEVVCEKCNTSRTVVLLMDSELTQNLEKKAYLPSFENYFNLGTEPTGTESTNLFPIPVNFQIDWWYCPYCNEMHKFEYDMFLGLTYNQEVVNISNSEIPSNKKLPQDDNLKKHIIGFDNDDNPTDLKTTLKQIEAIKKFELCICDDKGNSLSWNDIDNIRNEYTLLQTIVEDRKLRVNSKITMADRPPFCVFTVEGKRIIRLEYYQGHDSLELIYDIRAFEFYGKEIPVYQKSDGFTNVYGVESSIRYLRLISDDNDDTELAEQIMREAHDIHLNVKCKKYQARPSITLDEHRRLFQEDIEKMLMAL